MLKISQSVEKAVSEAEDYFGTLSNGNTVSCTDIITLADKEEVKKIAEKNDCDVKIGEFSVVFFDKGEVADNYKEMLGQSKKPIKSALTQKQKNKVLAYIKENDFFPCDDGESFYFIVPLDEEHIEMNPTFKKQLEDEGLYANSFVSGLTYNNNLPIDMKWLPIYGDSNRYITKWFKNSYESCFSDDLKDKGRNLARRLDIDSINIPQNVTSSRKLIKSGTSNFGSNDNIFGYNFPLVTYTAENYVYDEENDVETEERDYDADNYEYEGAMEDAENLADEMDIPMYKDYSEPYLCHEPFMIEIKNGYYDGIYIKIREGTNEEDVYKNDEYGSSYEGGRPFTDEEMKKFADKLNAYLDKLCSDYGWSKLGVTARFDNGETWYHKINNSRKLAKNVIKSSKTQEIFNKAILKAAELVKLSNEENEDEESVEKQNGELSDITSELIDLPFDFELEPQELKAYIKKVVPADYFDDERCWSYLYDIVYEDVYENIGFDAEPVNSSMRTNTKKPIKSSGAFVDKDEDGSPECIIEIKEDGKWKAVGIDKNSPDGWSTDVKFKVFPSVDEAKRSGMAKRIKNAGYSEPDTLRFSSK